MLSESTKTYIPIHGKTQVNLDEFNYKCKYRDSVFTLYLPCSRTKPYKNSTTHSYINMKLNEFIPENWRKLIKICTISEVIGIIPEELEETLFYDNREQFYYEHYPNFKENDILRTSKWLSNYIGNYGTIFNYSYCTSKVFREICDNSDLESFPKNFDPSSALFEFRKIINVQELTSTIIENYKNILLKRFKKWKNNNSLQYEILMFANEKDMFSLNEFRKQFPKIKNPNKNLDTYCHESKSDKGIFLNCDHLKKEYNIIDIVKKSIINN